MNIVIMSASENSKLLYKRFQNVTHNYTVVSVVEQDSAYWGELNHWNEVKAPLCGSVGSAVKKYRDKEVNAFVMPSLTEPENRGMFRLLSDLGVRDEDILYAPIELIRNENTSVDPSLFLTEFKERNELETIEFHVTDHCNLNCRFCSMFAGLVREKTFPDLNIFKRDILQLKRFFNHVKRIRIIGGEPLLNPELGKYLNFVRQVYPYSLIKVITNGILVKSISEDLLEIIRANNIHITVTYYPCILEKIDSICSFLKENGIMHDISPMTTRFQKIYDFQGRGDADYNYETCYWKSGCATLKEGKIAACFVPFVLPIASQVFSFDYQQSGLTDLYEEGLTASKIRERLETAFDTCRFCAHRGVFDHWGLIKDKNHPDIKEWCI